MPAKEFFLSLIKGTGYNIVVSPKVQGDITLTLNQVTLEEVLHTVRDIYGFEYVKKDKSYEIKVPELETKIFLVNHMSLKRSGSSSMSASGGGDDSSGGDGGSGTVSTAVQSRFWDELSSTLNVLVEGKSISGQQLIGKVSVSPETGMVVVKATPAGMRAVEAYLIRTEAISNRQIVLEASFLEVALKKEFTTGINWATLSASFQPTGATSNNTDSLADNMLPNNQLFSETNGNVFTFNKAIDSFGMAIKMLETEGHVTTLSNPKVSTMNNEKAIIKIGTDQYFVVNTSAVAISSSSSTSDVESSIDLSKFFSGVSLEVTPSINEDDSIILHVHPKISLTRGSTVDATVNGGSNRLPTALTTNREMDSVIKARNGQIVVLGGLMSSESDMRHSNIPTGGLGKVASAVSDALGTAQEAALKTELVILLKPVIVNDDTWAKQLTKLSEDHFKNDTYCSGLDCIKTETS